MNKKVELPLTPGRYRIGEEIHVVLTDKIEKGQKALVTKGDQMFIDTCTEVRESGIFTMGEEGDGDYFYKNGQWGRLVDQDDLMAMADTGIKAEWLPDDNRGASIRVRVKLPGIVDIDRVYSARTRTTCADEYRAHKAELEEEIDAAFKSLLFPIRAEQD